MTSPAGVTPIAAAARFTYLNLPDILGVVPPGGDPSGGTTVVITGSGFTSVTGPNGVKFGAFNAASYVVNSDTQITAKTKAHAVGVVDVVVTNLAGSSSLVAADRYTYFFTPDNGAYFDPYIFPSPSTGNMARVVYFMPGPGLANIRVYNEIGGLVDTLEERKSTGPQSSSINIGKLAPGVYFYLLNLKTDDGNTKKYKRKFVVTH